MNGDRPYSHYTETGFPYAAAYMDFYGGAAQDDPLNYVHAGTMHPPHQVLFFSVPMP